MRAGGIFGGDSLGSVGLGYSIVPGVTGGAEASVGVLCTLARNKGMLDRQMGRAYTRYVPTTPAEEQLIEHNPQQVIACYKAGWDSAANIACLTARTLGENDKRSGRPNDTTGLVKKTAGNPEDAPLLVECYNTGYNHTTAAKLPAQSSPPDPGDDGGTGLRLTPDTDVTGACTSGAVIKAVQAKIGTTADGKWGPASQAALKASGGTFRDWAPKCTGDKVPYYGGTGLTTTVATTTPGGVAPVVKPPLLGSMSNLSSLTSSPVFWAVLLAGGVGGYFYFTKPKKTKKNKRGSR
jgi:hypothetical protein